MQEIIDFSVVTEMAGDEVSQEQVERIERRYAWAAPFCTGRDVVEVACGTGQGLGVLAAKSRSLVAGDYSAKLLAVAKGHYGQRIDFKHFDAQRMPFPDHSKDVIILFEALYYLPDVRSFFKECARVLRSGGHLLIATANKGLYDFNPSPFSHEYFDAPDFHRVLPGYGFEVTCFGDTPLGTVSLRQKVLRPVKKLAVKLKVMPKTTHSKKWLKSLVFGKLVPMPAELSLDLNVKSENSVIPLSASEPDQKHKVIFCAAKLSATH